MNFRGSDDPVRLVRADLKNNKKKEELAKSREFLFGEI
jgi:hypothetical protein